MASLPSSVWVLGQIIETILEKRGFTEEDNFEQSIVQKAMLFFTGVLAISSMIGLGIGAFNHKQFLLVGIFSFILMIVLMWRLGVIKTLIKG